MMLDMQVNRSNTNSKTCTNNMYEISVLFYYLVILHSLFLEKLIINYYFNAGEKKHKITFKGRVII